MRTKIKNTWMIVIAVILIVAFGAFFIKGSDSPATGKSVLPNALSNGQVQVVKLSVVNGIYVFSPSEFKVGVPVRIEADIANMPGCSKTIVIPSFNIKKTLTTADNVVEFTPDKAGTFNIMCSMNMYKGTFTVLESDGSKSSYVEKTSTSASSTGGSCRMASGGGCGCGGGA